MINYNEQQNKRDLDDSGYGGGMTYSQPKQSGYGISNNVGMSEAEYNRDAEQNRNIDMGELNELLGI